MPGHRNEIVSHLDDRGRILTGMGFGRLPNMDRIERLTRDLDPPFAVLDGGALERNAVDLVRRAGGKPVRVASKSVRVRGVLERTLAREGFAGIMSYSLAESCWLADEGFDDILLAYPTAHRQALRDLVAKEHRFASITLMVDSTDSLDLVDSVLGADHAPIRVCLDVDASLRLGTLHVGVRRSPVRTPAQASVLARAIADRRGFTLVGAMFYDAQIAGLPDSSPVIRRLKARSNDELGLRRREVVAAIEQVAPLELVNAGGTGSLEVTGADDTVTELTAGSGLFTPTLFDAYDSFEPHPAAFFALSVVRKPAPDIATLFSGGYIASGQTSKRRQPRPAWPSDLRLLGSEGAGEVQTPVKGSAALALRVGDRVWMRHAKAGEMCERFDAVQLVGEDNRVQTLATYRGEGRNFG